MCLVGAGTETSPVPAARATLACAALGLVEPAVPNFACTWHIWYDMIVKSPLTNIQTDIFPYTEHIFNCFSKERGIQAPLCYELANSCLSLSALDSHSVVLCLIQSLSVHVTDVFHSAEVFICDTFARYAYNGKKYRQTFCLKYPSTIPWK